jgi:TonB family protein
VTTPKKKETIAAPVQKKPEVAIEPAKPVFTESDPQILHLEQPIFPPETIGSKAGGEVIVMVQIDPEGKPIKSLVAKTTNPVYNASIVTAVMKSTYRPGTTPDGPTTKWITIPFKIM